MKKTAEFISEANLDPDCPDWINFLATAYTEAYAQWFDSLGDSLRDFVLKDWQGLIVINNKTRAATRERNIISALNIVGTSIDRAAKITTIATREGFRNRKANRSLLFYAWIDKDGVPEKGRGRFGTANLPWKEFKDYPKACFQSTRSEYDGGQMTGDWETELRYHCKEELTVDIIKLRDEWAVKEIFRISIWENPFLSSARTYTRR